MIRLSKFLDALLSFILTNAPLLLPWTNPIIIKQLGIKDIENNDATKSSRCFIAKGWRCSC